MPGFAYPSPIDFASQQEVLKPPRGGSGSTSNSDTVRFDHGPAVGSHYNGSIVVDVKIEVTDGGTRVRKRSIITLENGAILKEDHFKDKTFKEVDAPRRRAPTRTRSNDDDLLSVKGNGSSGVSGSGSSNRPTRGLPKTKSGRDIPKPTGPPRPPLRPTLPTIPATVSNSRDRDFVRKPPGVSKSSDLEEMRRSSHRGEHRRGSRSSSRQRERETAASPNRCDPSTGPSSSNKPSSLRNLSNVLTSPKRKPPGKTKSTDALDLLRNSLHASSHHGSDVVDGYPPSPGSVQKPGSLRKLGNLISPARSGRKPPLKAKSADLDFMQEELLDAGGSKSKPFAGSKIKKENEKRPSLMHNQSSTATSESNREKLRSFKDMIAMPSPSSKKKSGIAAGSHGGQPYSRRRSSNADSSEDVAIPFNPQASTSTTNDPPRDREPSLSPEQVKKPASSSYLTSVLDSLYDSYMGGDMNDDDDNSDNDGLGRSHGLLESSLNRFVEWAE